MKKKFLIVDVQGYFTPEFEAKELAIYDGMTVKSWIFKPKTPYRNLSDTIKKNVKYVFYNIHGIHYNTGDIPYSHLNLILQELKEIDNIYVKGCIKMNFLLNLYLQMHLEPPKIINLEYSVNKVPNLHQCETNCKHHKLSMCSCSITNVRLLYEYIAERLNNENH